VSHAAKVWVALGTVYVLWGSTYLGIELAGETIPPLFAVAIRFIAAGLLLAAITYWHRGRRAFRMTLPQIGTAVLVGALLPGANAVLFVAERHVATGLSALIIGSVPLWIVVMRTANGDRPSAGALGAVLVGFAGLALLVHPSGGASLGYLLLVLCSAVMWAVGSYVTTVLPMPSDGFCCQVGGIHSPLYRSAAAYEKFSRSLKFVGAYLVAFRPFAQPGVPRIENRTLMLFLAAAWTARS